MPETELKTRANRLTQRAEMLPKLPMMQRAEQAVILAQETAALLAVMCNRLDALTPFQDEGCRAEP
ncbi:hypothetical protein PhaeoP83_01731 [Phaeobacter inhibens]|uniref:hypothetical protein n=1 Tax=Phaeobacter inhibens TaxID=221822 RepID=UPI00076BB958|nr:hypothetical protein [Phaeobacter inhibens]AUQ50004.1 hypothetical protein PhaeoP83_01731 [Phaeobacter inhibens]AUQ54268.1 hypothetical protein PhaeoP92_01587 [Phaeobacter inhibens]AUQ78284.1 hypothetical protein PhaeoP74_01588 [Phaeobacter inhibens]AUR15443.1 hypothetical protein PhaeoP70_01586 [Phaeobacter inhibens]AUR19809.1 hypothetical protein PhaeoP80_01731 [Phaeobacter inhibens]